MCVQTDLAARLQTVQQRTAQLGSVLLTFMTPSSDVEEGNYPTNPFESACKGDEQGIADMARWCAVYCGGSKPVIEIVHKIGKESGMHTEFEAFDW